MSSTNAPERRPAPWSLAARLTAWYTAFAFALVLVATGLLYGALVVSLDRDDDATLADRAHMLRVLLGTLPHDPEAVRQRAEWAWADSKPAQVYVRILDDDGRLLVETPGMGEVLPAAAFPPPLPVEREPGRGVDVGSAAGLPFRVLAARALVGGPGGVPCVIQVALDRRQEADLLAGYRRNLWVVLGLALLAGALGGYRIARRGIRPLREVIAVTRRVRSTTLDERVPAAGLPAELLALADTFNEMLDRLEESFGRLARFSTDIAHELRTPVNNLRGEVEVALGKPRGPEEYRDVLGSCLEECGRLARMIDSLLFLARAENPRTQVPREPVEVARELEAVRAFYEAAAAEVGVALRVAARPPLPAEVNRPLLQRAVGNLVENALAHTPAGGAVTLTAVREARGVRVEVADSGCGIPAEHLGHVFDRFYRADRARSAKGGGVGLGLAIVKGIVELHGGAVAIDSAVGRGTRVALVFPAAGGG
jgi:two-component system heavy metal sensor histidine kinase CusS